MGKRNVGIPFQPNAQSAAKYPAGMFWVVPEEDARQMGVYKNAPELLQHTPNPADQGNIDFDALSDQLIREKKGRSAALVRFMKDREVATFQEVMDGAFGELAEATVRSSVSRANTDLLELRSKLSFSTVQAHVIRHISRA
jgi:hypothetical protein